MKEAKNLLLVLSLVSLSHLGFSNTGKEGEKADVTVHGNISDASTRKPVQGVTISIQTQNVKHEITSDASGHFKLPKLPSGKVTIVLEKKGYKTYKREGVMLKEGMIINFNMNNLEQNDDAAFHPLQRMMDGFK
ncbi:MAG: carboxypeptidase-like regulatory domain-containing protein [Flavitalea sp.]